MSDPKNVHQMEQMLAAMLSIGAALGQLYKGMIAEGVPRADAVVVSASYAKGIAEAQWARNMDVDPDADD